MTIHVAHNSQTMQNSNNAKSLERNGHNQCLKRARREKTIENPIIAAEISVEKPAPVSIEGAGDGAVSDVEGK